MNEGKQARECLGLILTDGSWLKALVQYRQYPKIRLFSPALLSGRGCHILLSLPLLLLH